MPRKQDPVWQFFTRTATGKDFKTKRNRCAVVTQGHADRLTAHVEKCQAENTNLDSDASIQVIQVESSANARNTSNASALCSTLHYHTINHLDKSSYLYIELYVIYPLYVIRFLLCISSIMFY